MLECWDFKSKNSLSTELVSDDIVILTEQRDEYFPSLILASKWLIKAFLFTVLQSKIEFRRTGHFFSTLYLCRRRQVLTRLDSTVIDVDIILINLKNPIIAQIADRLSET